VKEKQNQNRPELLLGAAALIVVAVAMLIMATQPQQPETTAPAASFVSPFQPEPQPQPDIPAQTQPIDNLPPLNQEPIPPTTVIIGYTGVTIYEHIPGQTTLPTQSQPPQQTQPPVQQPGSAMININTASAAQLETLPGIGPARAQAIVEWRNQNGAFSDPAQLLEISGIGEATLRNILPFLYI